MHINLSIWCALKDFSSSERIDERARWNVYEILGIFHVHLLFDPNRKHVRKTRHRRSDLHIHVGRQDLLLLVRAGSHRSRHPIGQWVRQPFVTVQSVSHGASYGASHGASRRAADLQNYCCCIEDEEAAEQLRVLNDKGRPILASRYHWPMKVVEIYQ